MDPQILVNCSYIFLAAGIILLILTVVLFFKFGIIGIIRAEAAERKEAAESGNESYYNRVVSQIHKDASPENANGSGNDPAGDNMTTEEKRSYTVQNPKKKKKSPDPALSVPEGSPVPVAQEPDDEQSDASITPGCDSITVVVSGNRNKNDPGETVVTPRNKKRDLKDDDFFIVDDIIVIHGDPHAIK